MVYAGKIFTDIAFQHIRIAKIHPGFSRKIKRTTHSPVRTLPLATRKRVSDKFFFKQRFDYCHQGMVDNPVSEGRGVDKTFFGIVYIELAIHIYFVLFPYQPVLNVY